MEIKRIINLCKSSNGLILYENEGEQWISDGYALFPLTEMPLFDEETICRTYDISEKKAAKMSIRHEMKLPQNVSVAGDVEGGCLASLTTSCLPASCRYGLRRG